MSEPVVLVTAVGSASGSKAAAAALACAGSEPDRPGLLIDVGGRPPRPTLVASAGARELEERLAVHLPQLRAASRGQTCHLAIAEGPEAFGHVRAALPLVRDSVAVVHLPPALLQQALADPGMRLTGVLLRADLGEDRALIALTVRDLSGRGLRSKVLKQALGWVPARRALFGVLPAAAPGALSPGLAGSLLESETESENEMEHRCYDGFDDEKADSTRTPQRQRRDHARPGRRRGFHRHPQRETGR